jgi:small subunit ribosomal protein S20
MELPQRRTAIKELRKTRTRKLHNLDIKTDLKKTVKRFLSSVANKNVSEAETNLKNVYKKLDKAAKRNILHKNTASRRKSHFATTIKTIKS